MISHPGSTHDRFMTQQLWQIFQQDSPSSFHLLTSRHFVALLRTPWSHRLFISIVLSRGQVSFANQIIHRMMLIKSFTVFSLSAWLHWVTGLLTWLCCWLGIGTKACLQEQWVWKGHWALCGKQEVWIKWMSQSWLKICRGQTVHKWLCQRAATKQEVAKSSCSQAAW